MVVLLKSLEFHGLDMILKYKSSEIELFAFEIDSTGTVFICWTMNLTKT